MNHFYEQVAQAWGPVETPCCSSKRSIRRQKREHLATSTLSYGVDNPNHAATFTYISRVNISLAIYLRGLFVCGREGRGIGVSPRVADKGDSSRCPAGAAIFCCGVTKRIGISKSRMKNSKAELIRPV